MECEFHLQDPTSPDTVYLFEAIIAASRGGHFVCRPVCICVARWCRFTGQ